MRNRFLPFLVMCTIALPVAVSARDPRTDNQHQYGFIENKGQITDQNHRQNTAVKYLLNTPGLNVQLRDGGFSYDTYTAERKGDGQKPNTPAYLSNHKESIAVKYNFHRVDIGLEGSNPNCRIIAEDAAADVVNYYTDKEITSVHHYNKVTYKDIYQGIDMEFSTAAANDKPVEYNFIVHPGADASQIKLHYTGANSVALSDGRINIVVAQGNLQERIPASFISSTHEPVIVSYLSAGANSFSYGIGSYDHSKTLIIDPTPSLGWGSYYGGTSNDYGYCIAASGSSVYLGGYTTSSSSIATSGSFQSSLSSGLDGFVAKFNTATGTRVWGTYYGNVGDDLVLGMAADASAVYFTGQTTSTSGMTTSGTQQPGFGGTYDALLVKLDAVNGTRTWGTYYGGAGNEYGESVALDASGNIYMAGGTGSTSGIATTGQTTFGGTADAFIAKFNSSGVRQWGSYAGNSNLEEAYSVATDASGNVFMAGIVYSYTGTNNLSTSGSWQPGFGGDTTDYFIEKYNSGGVRQWGTFYGGSAGEVREDGQKLATDASGNVYLVGSTYSTNNIASASAYQTTASGSDEVGFIAKFNGSNSTRMWGTYYYGDQANTLTAVGTDANGNVYASGYALGFNGMESINAFQLFIAGNLDMTIGEFSSSGSFQWGSYYGDNNNEFGSGIAIDANGHVYIAGTTNSQFGGITTSGTEQPSFGGGVFDAFIARINVCNSVIAATANVVKPCYGQSNGMIVVNATGGTSPYLYSINSNPDQASDTFKNKGAGNYSITITDDNFCIGNVNVFLTQNAQITTPNITGSGSVPSLQSATYSTTAQTGVTYNWTAAGGTITSGQGTNQIQVSWGPVGSGIVKVVVNNSPNCADSATLNVNITPNAVVDVTGNVNVAVYPNPTSNEVYFDLSLIKEEKLAVILTDIAGRIIYNTGLQQYAAIKNTVTVPMTQLAAGTYFYQIKNNEGSNLVTGKVVKQ